MTRITHTLTRRLALLLGPVLVAAALGCREDARSPTAPELGPALDIGAAQALALRQVSAGSNHTCGLTTDDRAYCWGNNDLGQLGDGTTTLSRRPVAVAGGLSFRQVSAGAAHTCGITLDNLAYCWGNNSVGQLGDRTTTGRLTPIPVSGGLRFRQVKSGGSHTCGVTTGNLAYCWGSNFHGQLGKGTSAGPKTCIGFVACSTKPVAVVGGLRFRQVSAGDVGISGHTCGVTTDNLVYCWGASFHGQLGNGTSTGPETCFGDPCSTRPVAVVGGLRFRQVSVGGGGRGGGEGAHTCGVTMDNRAHCWGLNQFGQLGIGTNTGPEHCGSANLPCSSRPVLVGDGRRFLRVSAGGGHTCAVNSFDVAFCWGDNFEGQIGDNTTTERHTPVRVTGALRFRQVSEGKGDHTCGVTTGNLAYCWGDNRSGQLGIGTLLVRRRRPTPVVSPL
jgi:alpha-tubulin suppressor-like RCC1 family protein